tara:strand:- start:46 stop:243 length:198 start_codon:yes stop_codon:yes gene_type:complete
MSFDSNIMQSLLWSKYPEKMIKATEVMITMCKKYDLPINYKDLGIIEDDKENNSEDSLWNIIGRG